MALHGNHALQHTRVSELAVEWNPVNVIQAAVGQLQPGDDLDLARPHRPAAGDGGVALVGVGVRGVAGVAALPAKTGSPATGGAERPSQAVGAGAAPIPPFEKGERRSKVVSSRALR